MVRAAQHLVSQYGVEITAIITETIERWAPRKQPPASTARRLRPAIHPVKEQW